MLESDLLKYGKSFQRNFDPFQEVSLSLLNALRSEPLGRHLYGRSYSPSRRKGAGAGGMQGLRKNSLNLFPVGLDPLFRSVAMLERLSF